MVNPPLNEYYKFVIIDKCNLNIYNVSHTLSMKKKRITGVKTDKINIKNIIKWLYLLIRIYQNNGA